VCSCIFIGEERHVDIKRWNFGFIGVAAKYTQYLDLRGKAEIPAVLSDLT